MPALKATCLMPMYLYWSTFGQNGVAPVKMIAPVLEEIANDYQGKLKVCKMDVDANTETAPKFGIRGIPTLIIFKNGNAEATKVGALSKTQLSEFVDSAL